MQKLNPRQQKFVDNIMKGMSLVNAYREAGYHGKGHSDYSNASRLIRNDKVLAELKARIETRREVVSARLMSITDGATNAYIKILKLDARDNASLIEIQRKVAQDLLDRIGLKPEENIRHSGDMRIEIISAIPRPQDDKD